MTTRIAVGFVTMLVALLTMYTASKSAKEEGGETHAILCIILSLILYIWGVILFYTKPRRNPV